VNNFVNNFGSLFFGRVVEIRCATNSIGLSTGFEIICAGASRLAPRALIPLCGSANLIMHRRAFFPFRAGPHPRFFGHAAGVSVAVVETPVRLRTLAEDLSPVICRARRGLPRMVCREWSCLGLRLMTEF
jgi:hypothetical protein